ncbi:MAG: putative UDP-glucose 4-epimerase GalE1 [Candidatus Hydrogenedentota bacterium]
MSKSSSPPSLLLTGAGGYLGLETVRSLSAIRDQFRRIIALDVREIEEPLRCPGVEYVVCDVRSHDLADVIREGEVDSVVHLASIVTPGKRSDRAFEFSVDVLGTKNVLECCVASGVRHIVVTSSGAAYGYHPDNPEPLREDHPLRGNPEIAYADHKRLVEEMLAEYRESYPELKQLVFRPGTILGERTSNQITNLFEKRIVMGLRGTSTPFVFIWDHDVVACIIKGVLEQRSGIYNLAGDGTLTLREIAQRLHKPYLPLPAGLVRAALRVMKSLGLTRYGPEQVDFLRYRPVLANDRLKAEFGYVPRKTTAEAFEMYASARR